MKKLLKIAASTLAIVLCMIVFAGCDNFVLQKTGVGSESEYFIYGNIGKTYGFNNRYDRLELEKSDDGSIRLGRVYIIIEGKSLANGSIKILQNNTLLANETGYKNLTLYKDERRFEIVGAEYYSAPNVKVDATKALTIIVEYQQESADKTKTIEFPLQNIRL